LNTVTHTYYVFAESELKAVEHGAYLLRPLEPHKRHHFDGQLCRTLELLLAGKRVVDLGAGIGQYGRCLIRMKEPMFPESPEADTFFFE
jgi:hypothetical protein